MRAAQSSHSHTVLLPKHLSFCMGACVHCARLTVCACVYACVPHRVRVRLPACVCVAMHAGMQLAEPDATPAFTSGRAFAEDNWMGRPFEITQWFQRTTLKVGNWLVLDSHDLEGPSAEGRACLKGVHAHSKRRPVPSCSLYCPC